MSTFRKTVLTTAIIGAGLASTSGAAFATEGGHHEHKSHDSHSTSSGCSNAVKAKNTSAGKTFFGSVVGGDQAIRNLNVCDNLNGNSIASGNNIAGGDIHNGNTTTTTKSEQTALAEGKGATAIVSGLLG